MEIDEIKRCAWPWAACTVLGHRGGVGPAPRAPGGGAPAAVRAPGPAVPPTSPLSARAREGVRGHAHGRAVWLSAPQGQRRGLEAVWALTRMPLPCAAWACGRDNRGRAPGRASGMPVAAPCGASRIVGWRVGSIAWGGGGVGRCRSELGGLRRVVGIAGRRRGLRPSVRSPTPCVPRRPARRCPAVAPPASPAPAVPHPARRVRGGPKPVHLHELHVGARRPSTGA
jgi:hypothetical protein